MEEIRKNARKRLVTACSEVIGAVKDVIPLEDDHIMQHALITLQAECNWCAREFDDQEEDNETR